MLNKYIVYLNGTLGFAHKQGGKNISDEGADFVFQPVTEKTYNSSTDKKYKFSDFSVTDEISQKDYLKRKFVWGKILNFYSIGDYQIIEYISDVDGHNKETLYHVYINFSDSNVSATTLDKALIAALTIKYEGINSQAGIMFARMLKID